MTVTDPKQPVGSSFDNRIFAPCLGANCALGVCVNFPGFVQAIKRKPIVVWVLLLYLTIKLIGLIGSVFSWHQEILGDAPINGPIGLAIYTTAAVIFMALLVGSSLVALWTGSKSGLIVSCLIVCIYLYRSLLLDTVGGPVTINLDASGAASTAFLDVYGYRLHQLLQLVLASAPIWSKSTRRYVSWRT